MSDLQRIKVEDDSDDDVKENIIKCEFIDGPENTPTTVISGGYDIITTINHEICSESEESGSENNNEVKCEYLEYGDETSDNDNNANVHSMDIQQDSNDDGKCDLQVHEKLNNLGKHEDLFIIIVSDTEKKTKEDHSNTKVVKNKKLRKCDFCNKWYNTNYFSEHTKRVHGDENLKAKRAEIRAIKRKLRAKKVNCEICQKVVSKVNYKVHFATHDPNKSKYICDVCGKTFAQKRLLVVHTVTHNTEFNFECKLCPYKGRSSNLLRIHMIKHKGDYKYVCLECPAKFLTKSDLTKHSQSHMCKELMFTCDICQEGFNSKHKMECHIEIKHMRRFVCDICGLALKHRRSLLQHQVNVHKSEKNMHGRIPEIRKRNLITYKNKKSLRPTTIPSLGATSVQGTL